MLCAASGSVVNIAKNTKGQQRCWPFRHFQNLTR
jgi:hypothetical protein